MLWLVCLPVSTDKKKTLHQPSKGTNTDLVLFLGYVFENDSRVVPEKFEGECQASINFKALYWP